MVVIGQLYLSTPTVRKEDVPKMPSLQTLLINWYFSIGIVRGVFQAGCVLSGSSDRKRAGLAVVSEQMTTLGVIVECGCTNMEWSISS